MNGASLFGAGRIEGIERKENHGFRDVDRWA